MEYRQLGSSGLKVSLLGLGGDNFFPARLDMEQVRHIINAALDRGINFFDTADTRQGCREECLAEALGSRRREVVIATKVGGGTTGPSPNDRGASRRHILQAVHSSLRRLQTDHIDLLQMHAWDAATPLEETLGALDDLVRAGKVTYIGCSNYAAWQLTWAQQLGEHHGWSKFVSVQPHYNLLHRDPERELIPACQQFGVGVIPYYPLAGGLLSGKYASGEVPERVRGAPSQRVFERIATERFALICRLGEWARGRGHTLSALAIAWLTAQPAVSTIIVGASHKEHVEENTKAAAWKLTPEEVAEITTLTYVDR